MVLLLCLWRFVTGFGIGGSFPVSGSESFEDGEDIQSARQKAGWSVAGQTLGQVTTNASQPASLPACCLSSLRCVRILSSDNNVHHPPPITHHPGVAVRALLHCQ